MKTMPTTSKQQQILAALNGINTAIALQDQRSEERDKKTNKMYEILVTGNGKPSMELRVSKIEAWIEGERRLMWIVVTMLVTTLGGGMIWLIRTMIDLQSILATVK